MAQQCVTYGLLIGSPRQEPACSLEHAMRHRHTEELVRRCWGAHTGGHGGLEILRHIGPGLLVTGGFIDPGNWASNMAARSEFGYALLWVVTLSTLMLKVGCILVATVSLALLATNSYRHIERWSPASSRS